MADACPVVDILMPCFRARDTIVEAVKSVIRQTCADWNLLLIADDGADYAGMLQAEGLLDPRIRILRTGLPQSGPSVARNIGIDHARAEFLALLDADDFWSPDFLELTLPLAKRYGAALSNYRVFGDGVDDGKAQMFEADHDLMLTADDCAELTFMPKPVFARSLGVRFDETQRIGEITHCVFDLVDRIGSMPVATAANYSYRVRPASMIGGLRQNSACGQGKSDWMDSTGLAFRHGDVAQAYNTAIGNKSLHRDAFLRAAEARPDLTDYRVFVVNDDRLAYRGSPRRPSDPAVNGPFAFPASIR